MKLGSIPCTQFFNLLYTYNLQYDIQVSLARNIPAKNVFSLLFLTKSIAFPSKYYSSHNQMSPPLCALLYDASEYKLRSWLLTQLVFSLVQRQSFIHHLDRNLTWYGQQSDYPSTRTCCNLSELYLWDLLAITIYMYTSPLDLSLLQIQL